MIRAAALATLCVLSLTGCVTSSSGDASDKFEQTWPHSYSETTCSDWSDEMDDHQRFVAAADMLLGARSRDGDDTLVSDALIVEFQDGISNVCVEPTMSIADAAVGLYLTEPMFQP